MLLKELSAGSGDLWQIVCDAVQQEQDKVVFVCSETLNLHVGHPVSEHLVEDLAHVLRSVILRKLQLR